MLERFKKFDISKVHLFNGCLRFSIFTTIVAFVWVFIVEAPKHTSIAFGISDQDARDLRVKIKCKIEESDKRITEEEKNQIIKKWFIRLMSAFAHADEGVSI